MPKRYKLYLVESIIKLCFVIILIVYETTSMKFWISKTEAIVHVTAYSAIGLPSIVEILVYFGHDLPQKLDMFLMNCLSYAILGFLMVSHSELSEMHEVFMHKLLAYALIMCTFISLMEMINPQEILLTYGKIATILLQALLFVQTAFIIYGSNKSQWDPKNHETMMLLAAIFCWNIFCIIIFLIIQLFFIKKLYNSSSRVSKFINWLVLENDKKIDTHFTDEMRAKLLSEDSNMVLED